eukprot:319863-Pleurochrysis_carterae.AAC.1
MHAVPAAEAVSTLAALKQTCATCDCHATTEQRIVRAHEPVDGNVLPCDCCKFGHDRLTAQDEYEASAARMQALNTAARRREARRTSRRSSAATRRSTTAPIQ